MSVRQRIVGLCGEQVLRRSALNIRGGAGVFERVLSGRGYRTAIEIGTYRGCATAEIAQYVESVVTIDLRRGKLELAGEKFDRLGLWKALGIKNIQLCLVDDDADKAQLLRNIDFDFAFIDGAHQREAVELDFSLVKRCGRVLFHDYDRRGVPGQDDVYEFVNSLPRKEIAVMDIFALWVSPGRLRENAN